MSKVYIAPSILSADFNNLKEEIKLVESLGAEYLHFDVMDGHFVPNISFGQPVLKCIAHSHSMINDVHIMISEPKRYAKEFVDAGANILTFHFEACKDLKEVEEVIDIITFHIEACKSKKEIREIIKKIHDYDVAAGISIKPNTPVEVIYPVLHKLDLVLVMSVEPGFGGQKFIPSALDKIFKVKKLILEKGYKCLVEVDGGINEETGKLCKEAGVDILVAGSYLFGRSDIKERINKIR